MLIIKFYTLQTFFSQSNSDWNPDSVVTVAEARSLHPVTTYFCIILKLINSNQLYHENFKCNHLLNINFVKICQDIKSL